jgi:hypothetical protein
LEAKVISFSRAASFELRAARREPLRRQGAKSEEFYPTGLKLTACRCKGSVNDMFLKEEIIFLKGISFSRASSCEKDGVYFPAA